MDRAGPKCPTARRAIRLVQQRQGLVRTAAAQFESVVRAVDARFAESDCLGEKFLLLAHIANRKDRPVEAAHRFRLPNLFRRPALARIVLIFKYLEAQPGGMVESNELLPEALFCRPVIDSVPLEMLLPERQRAFGDRVGNGLNLSGSSLPRNPTIGKRGHDPTGLDVCIRVIQVVVRKAAIHQDGLLGQPLTDNSSKKIDIFLCFAGTGSNVVISGRGIIHGALLAGRRSSGKAFTVARTGVRSDDPMPCPTRCACKSARGYLLRPNRLCQYNLVFIHGRPDRKCHLFSLSMRVKNAARVYIVWTRYHS